VEVVEVKLPKKNSGHGNTIPKVQSHFDHAKSFSFADALKNSAPNPSPPLTKGRRSKKKQVAHEVGKNNSSVSEAFELLNPCWQPRGVRESSIH
jgi:hypothetical protein